MKTKALLSTLSTVIALIGASANVQAQSSMTAVTPQRTAQVVMPRHAGNDVVKSQCLGDGVVMQVVKNSQGALMKQLVVSPQSHAVKTLKRQVKNTPAKGASDDLLRESFEGWDGESPDWLPSPRKKVHVTVPSSLILMPITAGLKMWTRT